MSPASPQCPKDYVNGLITVARLYITCSVKNKNIVIEYLLLLTHEEKRKVLEKKGRW